MEISLLWHVGELGSIVGGAWIMGKMLVERVSKIEDRLDSAVESLRADVRAVHQRMDSEVARIPFRAREGA
jgi:hypothetical protein